MTHAPVAQGTPCLDGNVCNGAEACNAIGFCAAGTPPPTDDGNACTTDACHPTTGVSHTPVAAGTACLDGNVCNGAEACNATGTCQAGTPPTINDGNSCTTDACDPVAGVSHTPVATGTACPDGNACNGDELCNASAQCAAGTPIPTDDGNVCTNDECNPATGAVTHPPAPAGTLCTLDACTMASLCDGAGTCAGGAPIPIDDGNPCTVDLCTPEAGPSHEPVAAGEPCGPNLQCDGSGSCVEAVPPDPATVAPPLDLSVATTIGAATEFLYTGSNPIQIGVSPGDISTERAAVLRGKVLDRDSTPLAGVTVRITDHPEYGSTRTRNDGAFDLAVNGGGTLHVEFETSGYLPAQRTVSVPWRDYAHIDDVVLVPLDQQATVIASASPNVQVAAGSASNDTDGIRRARVFFMPGTEAAMRLPNGTSVPLSTLTVRATEYTVGPNGPAAMPQALPPSTAYTYAVELSADEAIAAGAERVEFSQPVVFFVDNFLNFPVGGAVPVGALDREAGAWLPEDNGRVVQVIDIQGGLAVLAVDATGQPAGATALAALGITNEERAALASQYEPGTSLWRVRVQHFTPYDCNWPFVPDRDPDDDDDDEDLEPVEEPDPIDKPCTALGSIIECQNQRLRESIPIPGTPYSLNYTSGNDRRAIVIPLTGTTVPSTLKRIELEVSIAGQLLKQTFPPTPNQSYTFEWNGRDAYGRILQGLQLATIRIGRVFPVRYVPPSQFAQAWAQFSDSPGIVFQADREAATVTVWRQTKRELGHWSRAPMGFGGWTLDRHHAYDPQRRTLNLGTGEQRSAGSMTDSLHIFTGGPPGVPPVPGGIARQSAANIPGGPVVAPDGTVYFADFVNGTPVLWAVAHDGKLRHVAGTLSGPRGFSGDGGPATAAQFDTIANPELDRHGNVFVVDIGNHRIRRIDRNGIVATVAGSGPVGGSAGFAGDGGPAVLARLNRPHTVVVSPSGELYISDTNNHRIPSRRTRGRHYHCSGQRSFERASR